MPWFPRKGASAATFSTTSTGPAVSVTRPFSGSVLSATMKYEPRGTPRVSHAADCAAPLSSGMFVTMANWSAVVARFPSPSA